MKLKCNKCKKTLTTDLYQSRHFKQRYTPYTYNGKDYFETEAYIQKGSFVNSYFDNTEFKYQRATIDVNEENVTVKLPDFKSGMGCCNLWMEDVHCECGNHIGEANLDCHVAVKGVEFYDKKVIRSYK